MLTSGVQKPISGWPDDLLSHGCLKNWFGLGDILQSIWKGKPLNEGENVTKTYPEKTVLMQGLDFMTGLMVWPDVWGVRNKIHCIPSCHNKRQLTLYPTVSNKKTKNTEYCVSAVRGSQGRRRCQRLPPPSQNTHVSRRMANCEWVQGEVCTVFRARIQEFKFNLTQGPSWKAKIYCSLNPASKKFFRTSGTAQSESAMKKIAGFVWPWAPTWH